MSLQETLFRFFNGADDGVEVRPVAGIEFGVEQFAIGANFKSAAARRNERERFDAFAEFKNFGRQTDGLRRVISNDAIFDRDFRLHPVRAPFHKKGKKVRRLGQGVSPPGFGNVSTSVREKRSRFSDFRDRPSNPFPNAP